MYNENINILKYVKLCSYSLTYTQKHHLTFYSMFVCQVEYLNKYQHAKNNVYLSTLSILHIVLKQIAFCLLFSL